MKIMFRAIDKDLVVDFPPRTKKWFPVNLPRKDDIVTGYFQTYLVTDVEWSLNLDRVTVHLKPLPRKDES